MEAQKNLMKKKTSIILLSIYLLNISCNQKQKADTLFYNAKVYSVDSVNSTFTAFVVKEGKFLAIGDERELLSKYAVNEKIDVGWKFVYPGFNDAHAHFYGFGLYLQQVDLTKTKSWNEVIERCKLFYKNHPDLKCLTGRGWDQNDWEIKEFPANDELNKLFPNIAVMLKRVDGHAAIVNYFLLNKSGINKNTKISGGEIVLKNEIPTGVLIDNAFDIVKKYIPEISKEEKINALIEAEKNCFQNGLTSLCDAGLDRDMIELIDSLQRSGKLSMRIYAMINASENNINYYLKREPYKTDKLTVCSFKLYADGALGSRGACLLHPYSDKKNNYGFLLSDKEKLEKTVLQISQSKYQLCTHCIGDSANRLMLNLYAKYLKGKNKKRWRIEHAQVIDENDFKYFGAYNIIPSVQPTHATSDMKWAINRLGKERLKNAYAYKKLLDQNGWLPLGTDFPVESVNPFFTFYSSVSRKDENGLPQNGFQIENALTREETLRGMSIWPAKAAFEEKEKGSIEPGKFADFIILDVDLLKNEMTNIRNSKVKATYLNGILVYTN